MKPQQTIDILKQEEENVEELLETRYIDRNNSTFARTKGGFVALDFDGKHYDRIAIHRAFPFTDPEKFLSIREPDGKMREIGMIRDLKDVDKDTQQMLLEQIDLRYFTPVIQKVNHIKEEYGYSYWDVVTDKGACRFTMRTNSIVKLSDVRLLITDIDGNRFEVPDVMKLSAKELKMIDLYI